MFIAAIIYVAADVLRAYGAFGPTNVGSIAHLSGIGIGFLIGIYYRRKFKQPRNQKVEIKFDENSMKNWEDNFMR